MKIKELTKTYNIVLFHHKYGTDAFLIEDKSKTENFIKELKLDNGFNELEDSIEIQTVEPVC